MYIHLGQDISVNDKFIIGIFDIENTSIGKSTKGFLKSSTEKGIVVNVSYEMPKSFIICRFSDNTEIVYISQISASVLKKRLR